MVKELYVEEAPKAVEWEEELQYLYEYAVEGVPLPEDYENLLKDRHFYYPSDQSTQSVLSEAVWNEYAVWLSNQGIDISTDERSPRERLELFFARS